MTLEQKITRKQSQITELWREIAILRDQIRPTCNHPFTEPYEWESDDGYGTQRMVMGRRCTLCLKVDHWLTDRWSE